MKNKEKLLDYPTIPALIGKHVYLRPTEAEDIKIIQQWRLATDPQTISCHPTKVASPDEVYERFRKKEPRPDEANFAIAAVDDHRTVGQLNYFHLNRLNRSAEIGFLIAPAERRHGFATEAMRLMIDYLLVDMNLNKVYAQTGSFNKASIRLLEGLDFQLDGTLRQHHYYRGDLYDDLIYSLLKFEYSP